MKFKTLFKTLSGLAISSSLLPVVMSLNRTHTHTHTQDSLNVGNYTSKENDEVEGVLTYSWETITIDNQSYTGWLVSGVENQDKSSVTIINIPATYSDPESQHRDGIVIGIKRRAFLRCQSLKTVNFKENSNFKTIDDSAFNNCTSLASISIPNSVNSIGQYTFKNCTSLASVNIPNGVDVLASSVFEGCTLLANVNIPDSVTSIGSLAFFGCSSLTNIKISNSVARINNSAFKDCSLLSSFNTSWTLDQLNNLTVQGRIFDGINNITINAKNPDGRNHDELLNKYQEKFTTELTRAGSITINVDPDQPDAFWDIDENGVISHKENVEIPAELHIPKAVVNNDRVKTVVKKIKDDAFSNNNTITSLVFDDLDENQNTEIGDGAFENCSNLASVNISKGVAVISFDAFKNCTALESVNIPNGVTSIRSGVFNGCTSLTNVNIPGSVSDIGDGLFQSCTSLKSVNISSGVTSIGGGDFNNCTSLANITLPNSITSIGGGAFQYCSALTSVNIPDKVTTINDATFDGCIALTNIIIPNNVTSINSGAFHDCSALTSISVPNSVKSIYEAAFFCCSSLTNIKISNSVTTIGARAFYLQSTNHVNVEIHQDIDHADKESSDALKDQYKTKFTEAALTNPTTYTTWFDSNTTSPEETFDITSLNAQIDTTIGAGFKTWKDESPNTRSITINCNVSDQSFNGTAKFNDNYSKIITNITGHKEGFESLDIIFTPILTLNDSANNFEKEINLASGTIHLEHKPDPTPPTPETHTNIWAPLMGGIFGGIAFSGLTTGTILVIKNKRNKEKNK